MSDPRINGSQHVDYSAHRQPVDVKANSDASKFSRKVSVHDEPERHTGNAEKPDNFNPRSIQDRNPRKLSRKEKASLFLLKIGLSFLKGKQKALLADKALHHLLRANSSDDTILARRLQGVLETAKSPLTTQQQSYFDNLKDSFYRTEDDLEMFGEDDGNLFVNSRLSFGDDEATNQPKLEFRESPINEAAILYEQGNKVDALSALSTLLVNYESRSISSQMLEEVSVAENFEQEDLLENFSGLIQEVITEIPHPLVSLESYLSIAQSAASLYPDNEALGEAVSAINANIHALRTDQ